MTGAVRGGLAGARRRPFLAVLLVAVLALAVALTIRYQVVEPRWISTLCRSGDPPGWCQPRDWMLWANRHQLPGFAALAAAAWATLGRGGIGWACAAAALGSFALALYQAELGALALLLALLTSLRR